ncbi:MAG: hypothetical protein KKB20_03635 [Proteobacteria bacterium]|nr:hypothetical protein [Pseudomonadota bacterium]
MKNLKDDLINMALAMGAIRAGVADLAALQGPPSADPAYLLPGARSVVAFALPLGRDWIPDYFSKKTRRVFADVMYDTYQSIGAIGGRLKDMLESAGFPAAAPQPNGVYRREASKPGGFMVPDFSLRYAALASGVGTLGWSGNVMVEGHWSAVFLGAVLTEADLPPDAPLESNLCDGCRICSRVCPLGFVQAKASDSVTLGGREYVCNAKGNHMRCGLVCAGLVGLSRDRAWSTWATLRYRVGEDDRALGLAFNRALSDPASEYIRGHIFSDNLRHGVLARGREETQPTCCNCALVCSGPREHRQALMERLHASGIVVRREDGTELAVRPEHLDPLITFDTENEGG